jgi:broad specificity phosphatase PhoE
MIAMQSAPARRNGDVTTIFLVRHGRTALNAADVLRGRLDEPLDAEGVIEAVRLSLLFAKTPLKTVVSSPLRRALETATWIAGPHHMVVLTDEGWIDRDYGPWAGQPLAKVDQTYGSLDGAPENEIEPSRVVLERSLCALRQLLARVKGGQGAVVAHDAVNRVLIRHFTTVKPDSVIRQPTGCWNRLSFTGEACEIDIIGALPRDGRQP